MIHKETDFIRLLPEILQYHKFGRWNRVHGICDLSKCIKAKRRLRIVTSGKCGIDNIIDHII